MARLHGGSSDACSCGEWLNGAHVGGFVGKVICSFYVEISMRILRMNNRSATIAVMSWSTEVVAMLRTQAEKIEKRWGACYHLCLFTLFELRAIAFFRLAFSSLFTQHQRINHPEQSPTPTPLSPR